MIPSLHAQVIGLAGLFQSLALVQQIAWQGSADQQSVEACLRSIIQLDPTNYEDVYGGIPKLRIGLESLHDLLLRKSTQNNAELTRYAVAVLHLERKLQRRSQMLDQIRSGIEAAEEQLEFFDITHINIISRFADIYQQSISKIGPRIIVHGEQTHLSNGDNASRIRALLLAAIRAAVLWRQAGGSRWKLFIRRAALLEELNVLLETA